MIVEGRGVVAPSPELVRLMEGDFVTMHEVATRRARFRAYATRCDAWGRGLVDGLPSLPSDALPAFIGMAGEIACARYINARVGRMICCADTRLLMHGDLGVDLSPFGYHIQVKTSHGTQESGLIRAVQAPGHAVLPRAFVFASWPSGMTVALVGWATSRRVRCTRPRYAKRGSHMNYEVNVRDMQPMRELVDLIRAAEARRERRTQPIWP